jgi:pimeloyl-ACP methyl ester carboxylesterase
MDPRDDARSRTAAGIAAAVALAVEYADALVLGTVRDVHEAVATRSFGAAAVLGGEAVRVPQRAHAAVTRGVYGALGAGFGAVATGLRAVERRGVGPRLEATPAGRHVLSAVNGLVGDRLREDRPRLAIDMAVRSDGRDVPLVAEGLQEAFPAATGDVVVFLHGLGENDDSWNRRADGLDGSYGTRLAATTSWTPVYLRANTGLPLAENGVALASLLDDLVAAWPVPVRRLALVGHSMGGLILRAACAVSTDAQRPWRDLVSDVVTLGTPHLGAPLERAVAIGARALGSLPEAAPFGRILDYRSVGILNLRDGLAGDVQRLPHARYHLVAATLAGRGHPISVALGDLLVRYPSATARPRGGVAMFPDADVLHVPGAGHFALLNHPDVDAALRAWLSRPAPTRSSE